MGVHQRTPHAALETAGVAGIRAGSITAKHLPDSNSISCRLPLRRSAPLRMGRDPQLWRGHRTHPIRKLLVFTILHSRAVANLESNLPVDGATPESNGSARRHAADVPGSAALAGDRVTQCNAESYPSASTLYSSAASRGACDPRADFKIVH